DPVVGREDGAPRGRPRSGQARRLRRRGRGARQREGARLARCAHRARRRPSRAHPLQRRAGTRDHSDPGGHRGRRALPGLTRPPGGQPAGQAESEILRLTRCLELGHPKKSRDPNVGATFLITAREGFEAALLLGLVYASLNRLGRRDQFRNVTVGAWVGFLASVLMGIAVTVLSGPLLDLGPDLIAAAGIFAAVRLPTWHGWGVRQPAPAARRADERRRGAP